MYAESFNKKIYPNAIIYAIFFIFFQVLGGKLLSLININFITNNMTFWIYFLLFILSVIIFGKILINSIKTLFSKFDFNSLVLIGIITFFAIVFSGIVLEVTGISNSNEQEIDSALNIDCITYILIAVAAILFAPIAEELFFRFLLYRSVEKCNFVLAHILVAVLFGFFHVWEYIIFDKNYIQFISMISYICMSLGFSILYQKTKNIWYPIILHAVINFIAIVL